MVTPMPDISQSHTPVGFHTALDLGDVRLISATVSETSYPPADLRATRATKRFHCMTLLYCNYPRYPYYSSG